MGEKYKVGDITFDGTIVRMYTDSGYIFTTDGHYTYARKGDVAEENWRVTPYEKVVLTLTDIHKMLTQNDYSVR